MALASVAVLGLVVSLALSTLLSVVILPPTRSVLQRSCPSGEGVSFWTRFTVLMLFLGPLIVTLIFGVPYSELSSKLTTASWRALRAQPACARASSRAVCTVSGALACA